jgi:hypothetical protein
MGKAQSLQSCTCVNFRKILSGNDKYIFLVRINAYENCMIYWASGNSGPLKIKVQDSKLSFEAIRSHLFLR